MSGINFIQHLLLRMLVVDDVKEVVYSDSRFRNENVEILLNNLFRQCISKIALHDCRGINFIKKEDIISIQSNNSYTLFSIEGKEQQVSTKPIKDYEELLCGDGFYRIHNTCLINLKHVCRYIKGEGGVVVLSNNAQHEVSRRRKSDFLEMLSKQVKL
jgi:two-component system LytT family response regulator